MENNRKGTTVARSYLYQSTAPTAETKVTYSQNEGKTRKLVHGQSSTEVTLLPHRDNYKHVEEAKKHMPSTAVSYNLQCGNRGAFRSKEKENGRNNHGNRMNFGANMYAEEPISPTSLVLSKTPLPVIGGRSYTYSTAKIKIISFN